MRLRKHVCTALPVLLVSSWLGGSAIAQSKSGDDTVTRAEFERRLDELEQKYKNDIAARDKAIADLQKQLTGKVTPEKLEWFEEQKSKLKQEVLDAVRLPSNSGGDGSSFDRTPVGFNPDIAVIGDFLGTWSNQRRNDAYNRLDVREVELDLRAAVDPRADAVVILAFARDVENSVFPEGGQLSGPDTSVDVEEAYLFLHDFGVPNLTAKVGRFHLRFGRQNLLHLHALPTSDPPFVNQAFLAPEALSGSGVSFSYLIPNPWDQYLEANVEIIAGKGAGSESPTLRGDLAVDSPAINTHLLWNTDLGNWNLELGGSWLWGHTDPDNSLDLNLFGGDITLLRTDPSGGFNNQLLQAEAMYALLDQADGSTNEAWGAYLLAQQQLNKDWYAGVRFDWTEDPNDPHQEVWGVSPYLSWYWSEFLRFRVEYQHRGGDEPDADVIMFQMTWIYGAHPPHPAWSMRCAAFPSHRNPKGLNHVHATPDFKHGTDDGDDRAGRPAHRHHDHGLRRPRSADWRGSCGGTLGDERAGERPQRHGQADRDAQAQQGRPVRTQRLGC